MKITITDRAKQAIEKKVEDRSGFLKLYYDIEDCGCAGGVPELLYVKEINEKEDLQVETEFGTMLVEESQTIYFDEVLTIDFSEALNVFQLKSPAGFLNPMMRLTIQG